MADTRGPSIPSSPIPDKSFPSHNPNSGSPTRTNMIEEEGAPKNNDLIHTSDARLNKKITDFLEICPSYTTTEARNILSSYNGNLWNAVNQAFHYPPGTAKHGAREAHPTHAEGTAATATTPKPLLSSPTSAGPPKSGFSGDPHMGGVLPSIVLNLRNPGRVEGVTPNEEEPSENSNGKRPALLDNSSSDLPIKYEVSDSEEIEEDEEGKGEDDEYSGPEPTFYEKAGILHAIFPMATLDDCEKAVNYCGGSLDEAVASLEEDYSLSDDAITRKNDGRRDSGVAGLGTNFRRERGRSTERSDRAQKRRRSDSVEERLAKRARGRESERNMTSLPTAGQWVYNMFEESNGVLVILDSGEVPYKIPKKILYDSSQFFKAAIDSATAQELAENGIRVQGASLNIFNLAMQWIGCNKIRLEPSQCRSKASELTAVTELVQLGVMLGIRNIDQSMVERLRDIIIEDRDALKGHHIRIAFALGPGHGIRTLFVNACVRLLIDFRGDDNSGSDPGYGDDEEEVDAARLGAFAPRRFRFQAEMDVIEDFERNLLRAVQRTLTSREMVRVQRNKTMFTAYFEDPLTEERFTL